MYILSVQPFCFCKTLSDLCNYVFHHMFVVFILSPSAVRVVKLVKFIVFFLSIKSFKLKMVL